MSQNDRLRELLIEAGINGLTQKQITLALKNHMFAEQIKRTLEEWKKEGYVQKFRVEAGAYRPITVWRATTLIRQLKEEEI